MEKKAEKVLIAHLTSRDASKTGLYKVSGVLSRKTKKSAYIGSVRFSLELYKMKVFEKIL